ncbi:platelet-activating factor acetylhydrolase [Calycina marina]|uniref:Putative phospholipase n=1 Tax=Calycina marina TaxID=1763456 RepID=A0A9P7Z1L0_9HELO|nr:platelet-activating factor acetylhydrolase [Calycina marina]
MSSSYFSRLSPVPGFPSYTGPYKVGSVDVEIPVADLHSPSPAPGDLETIQYRIFYPCEPTAKGKSVSWIPSPQRAHISAYSRFAGAGSALAEFISFFPRIFHYISIPVNENAPLLIPTTSNSRWPVMIFSHGLAGNRNTYSHVVGTIASHGVIVVAPEHRDGSTPISYILEVPTNGKNEKSVAKSARRTVDYVKLSHIASKDVEDGRNEQLKIRLWELGLAYDSLLKIDEGKTPRNLDGMAASLSMFKDQMDVHTPGKISFAGHSFGGATITQFVKSTFYAPEATQAPKSYQPVFSPFLDSSLVKQITPNTPVILLDIWCLPVRAQSTRWLWNKPFPCYARDGPGGSALLAVESQAFFKWRVHLKATKRLLSNDPSSATSSQKPASEPNFYYATTAAHLSQSDFGILFPWLVKKFFAVEEPIRIIKLNVRAVLQVLRGQGIEVSKTSAADMELEGEQKAVEQDELIFGTKQDIRGWNYLSTNVDDMDDVDFETSGQSSETSSVSDMNKEPKEAVMENEVWAEA